MNVKINGEDVTLEKKDISVSELLAHQKVDMPDMVTVELNGTILDRESFETTIVKEGDSLEFLYFMGGGAVS